MKAVKSLEPGTLTGSTLQLNMGECVANPLLEQRGRYRFSLALESCHPSILHLVETVFTGSFIVEV